jgi:hypothetical protein
MSGAGIVGRMRRGVKGGSHLSVLEFLETVPGREELLSGERSDEVFY